MYKCWSNMSKGMNRLQINNNIASWSKLMKQIYIQISFPSQTLKMQSFV